MRNRWPGYILALLAAVALIAASVFAPGALLRRQEAGILGEVSYLRYGNYPNRTARPTVTPTASPPPTEAPTPAPATATPGDNTERIIEKIVIMQNGVPSILKTPSAGDLDMKAAIIRCSDQIRKLFKENALPPLPNFPEQYDVTATPQAYVASDGRYFDFWSVNFNTNARLAKTHGGIALLMDAETGAIYTIKMYTAGTSGDFDVLVSARCIAGMLGVGGTLRQGRPDGPDAVWVATGNTLYISFYSRQSSDGASFSMFMSTSPPS